MSLSITRRFLQKIDPVIDSVDGITMSQYPISKNQWGFQTMFKGKNIGVKEVMVYVDSLPAFAGK